MVDIDNIKQVLDRECLKRKGTRCPVQIAKASIYSDDALVDKPMVCYFCNENKPLAVEISELE